LQINVNSLIEDVWTQLGNFVILRLHSYMDRLAEFQV